MKLSGQESSRFIVLDVFRGMTIFLMIVVNTPGSGAGPFSPLLHAQWNGFTLTDLVFPSFLFAVGNAMAFSLFKYAGREFFYKVIKRTVLIFFIGYILNWIVSVHWVSGSGIAMNRLQDVRVMGVLQRIALCYCFAALILKSLSPHKVFILCIVLLVGYFIVLNVFSLSLPDSIPDNAVRRLDLWLFNEKNLYREGSIAFDPEGILSTIPAIVNVIAGYFAGKIVQQYGKSYECVARLMIIGNVLIILALLWNLSFPLNKKLWTSSFVLLTVGIDFVVVGILLFLTELKSITTGVHFFSVFGKNPLFIYILADIFGLFFALPVSSSQNFYDWVNGNFYQQLAPGATGSLLFAISFTLLCWFAGWIMDKNKIYIRI